MAINFPGNPSHEQVWPAEGDFTNLSETKGVIFQYDKFTNSWDIVGPDNIATTEWVLNQKKDDTTNLERAYDLVTATNDIGVDVGYNTTLDLNCNALFEQTVRGGVSAPNQDPTLGGEGKPIEEVLDYAFPEWAACVSSNGLGAGGSSFIGINPDTANDTNDGTVSTLSLKYKDLIGFVLNDTDKDGEQVGWFDKVVTDDTLELSFEGSVGNVEYAIYRITQVSKVDDTRIRVRILFVGSSHPDKEYNGATGAKTHYQFRTYSRSVTTAGATFDGPVRVKVDDDRALVAKPKDTDSDDSFAVDTISGRVEVSESYNSKLGTSGYDDPTLLCTYGYVTARLGEDLPGTRGPWLPLSGGTMTNENGTIVKNQVGGSLSARTFTIRGKINSGSGGNGDLFTVANSGGIDYIALHSSVSSPSDAVLNKSQIQSLIASSADGTSYVKTRGDTMTGILLLHASPSNNSNKLQAATKEYADSKEYVHNGQTNENGRIWTDNTTLYFNPY